MELTEFHLLSRPFKYLIFVVSQKMDVVLQKELLESAANRARLAFQIVEHLTTGQTKTEESTEEEDKQTPTDEEMVEFIREFVNPMQTEEIEHAG